MKTVQITRKIVFHAGHMLKDDKSKCYHPHGHEYVLECTVEGPIQEEGEESGMVINFGNLKEIMMEMVHDVFDHKFILQRTDPRADKFIEAVGEEGVVLLNWTPTAENLVGLCFHVVGSKLPNGVEIVKARLQETLNCWAEYYG